MLRELMIVLRREHKLLQCEKAWRKKNSHNYTSLGRCCDINKVSVGKGTYGVVNAYMYGDADTYLRIGNYCSIAENVSFICGEHDYKNLSTYPFKEYFLHEHEFDYSKGPIVIEDDVWIGFGVTILSGVTIGQGAVIGAGSIVRKSVPPYAIVLDGYVKKYRFDSQTINLLNEIDYSTLDTNLINTYKDILYHHVDDKFFETGFYKAVKRVH